MAPVPDEGSGIPTPDWAAHGAELELDPKNFRNYGLNIAKVGADLNSDTMSANSALQGAGPKDMLMSTSFEPGQDVQDFADRNAQEISLFITDLYKNVTAISSVALLMGEVFDTMDGNNAAMVNAVEWAFAMDGAKKPSGLPSWIDPKRTIASELTPPPGTGVTSTGGDEKLNTIIVGNMTITTYRTSDGGTRTVQSNGATTTEYLDDKSGKRQYMIVSTKESGYDQTVTTLYQNGAPAGETRRVTKHDVNDDPNIVDQVTTVQNLDADGKPVKGEEGGKSAQHVVTHNYSDGTHSREYYTETTTKSPAGEEKTVRSDDRYVGTQADPPTGEDWRTSSDERIEEARRAAGM